MTHSFYEFKPEDARAFARDQHIQVREKGDELHFVKCPYCGNRTSDKNTFAINLKTGQFKCLRSSCGAQGNMLTLAQDFGFSLGTDIDEYYQPKKEFKTFKVPETIIPKDPAIRYLESRGISEEVTKKYEITTQTSNDKILVFPFKTSENETPFIKYRKTDFKKGRDKNKEWCQADGKPILFGMKQCDLSNDTLIITEGQIDSLSVAEAGYTNAVSVPTGCNGFTWVPYCWDWIQNFKTIIVFGDYEHGHMTLLDEIKHRFRKNIKHVRFEDYKDCKDANAILQKYGRDQVRACIENAQAEPLRGIRDLSGITPENPYDIPKIKTGIKQVDDLLKGGLPIGGLTIITGKAGEGKSVLASQILLEALDQGHKIYAYSGELMDSAFKAIASLQAGGRHCYKYQTRNGYEGYTISNQNQVLIDNWMRGRFFIYDETDEEEEDKPQLTELIMDAITKCGVDVILIDNLMTAISLESFSETNKYEQQSLLVKKLAAIAKSKKVVIILVAHMRKNNSGYNGNDEVAGSSDITNLAAITLMYEKDSELKPEQRRLKVWKNRLFGYNNPSGYVMDYDEKSKRIYGVGDNPNKEYGWYVPEFEPADPTALPFT